MQEEDVDERIKKTSGSPSDDKSYINQGARPKVKVQVLSNTNGSGEGSNSITNGSTSQRKKKKKKERGRNYQNGASSSSSLSSASSMSSLNEVLGVRPKDSVRSRIFSSRESDQRLNDSRRRTGNFNENENSSGNEGEDGQSEDDWCIYTYKGDQFADLPNSFFPFEMAEQDGDEHNRENCNEGSYRGNEDDERSNPGSSPEMDYLEMDFDPGPSLEQDSEDEIDCFERENNTNQIQDLPAEKQIDNSVENKNSTEGREENHNHQEPRPGPSYENVYQCSHNRAVNCSNNNVGRTRETLSTCQGSQYSIDESSDNCDVGSDEKLEFDADDKHGNACNSQSHGGRRLDKNKLWTDDKELSRGGKCVTESDLKMPFEGVMLWTEPEAISNQVTLASSEVSCGATAVINVMLALKMRFSIEKVKEGISTRLRSDSASIPQYLVSRSFAGVAHENLIRGIHHASHGALYAKFFQMYPRRDVALSRWLSRWMKMGAVPIATMNVQRDGRGPRNSAGATSSDSSATDNRHHQMIFGVNSKGIHLTNPMECLTDEELWTRLTSPSVLLIKRQEIVSRWSPDTNLKPLMFQTDDRWKTMNVLGQVVNVIRESPDISAQGKFLTQHISIPASSGITLVVPRDSNGYEELVAATELPLSSPSKSK